MLNYLPSLYYSTYEQRDDCNRQYSTSPSSRVSQYYLSFKVNIIYIPTPYFLRLQYQRNTIFLLHDAFLFMFHHLLHKLLNSSCDTENIWKGFTIFLNTSNNFKFRRHDLPTSIVLVLCCDQEHTDTILWRKICEWTKYALSVISNTVFTLFLYSAEVRKTNIESTWPEKSNTTCLQEKL